MILHLYLARRFLRAFAMVFAVFVAVILPIDLADQVRDIGADHGFGAILELALLNLPGTLYELMPLFVLLATLILFLGFARSSEFVVLRASGRSALRSALSPILTAMILGIMGATVFNPIVAVTEKRHALRAAQYSGAGGQIVSVSAEGLWLRQGDPAGGQTVIRAERTNADATHLFGTTFFTFDTSGGLVHRITAAEAVLTPGAWRLSQAIRWPFAGAQNPQAAAQDFANLALPSMLTREQIRDSFGNPETVPIYELPSFIARLNQAGFAALQHRVWLQIELSSPIMLAAMVLIGAAFSMRPTRFGGTGIRVLAAILLGFGLFFIRGFAQVLGESGQLSPYLAAWTPPFAASLFALGLVLNAEDG